MISFLARRSRGSRFSVAASSITRSPHLTASCCCTSFDDHTCISPDLLQLFSTRLFPSLPRSFRIDAKNNVHSGLIGEELAYFHHVPSRAFCSNAGESPPYQVIGLPALSPTMAKGNIPSWSKKEGDKVSVGDVLCLIETDKSTMEMEAMEEGFLAKILVPAGSTDVEVGQPIAIIVENEEDIAKVKNISSPSSAATSTEIKSPKKDDKATKEAGSPPGPSIPPSTESHLTEALPSRQRLGPSVRRLLTESGIDVAKVKGTGPGGSVVKGDVIAAMKSGGKATGSKKGERESETKAAGKASLKGSLEAVPSHSSMTYEDIPTSQIRKIIARRLLESKNGIPHLYLSADTALDGTLALRKQMKANYGVQLSVNDFVIKAVASALKIVPEANARWDENAGVVSQSSIDISIAVATDKGLMTPIVRNADQKSLSDISSEVKVLAQKAREGKLQPHEFQGGSFSISNLGMFEVDHFCAIINPPQACILAVGRGSPSVAWQEDPIDPSQGKPIDVTKVTLTLSADHRVVDVDIGGLFLDALTGILRDPLKHFM